MAILNVEIKAQCVDPNRIKEILNERQAKFIGIDHQVDTYFKVPKGRLKLREGNIEHSLIHYVRPDQTGPKQSQVHLYHPAKDAGLKEVLTYALGIFIVVDKQRAIYFIDNVKFHLDHVKDLGAFVEIEAIDKDGTIGKDKLLEQCHFYLTLFKISDKDLVEKSYSDMLQP